FAPMGAKNNKNHATRQTNVWLVETSYKGQGNAASPLPLQGGNSFWGTSNPGRRRVRLALG
ncbi:MAG: hypothetical protein FWE95_08645, partial [Planctomycetaceae bacterium]|nr:hypothetical protein [Planctomycetaceae bacterium]